MRFAGHRGHGRQFLEGKGIVGKRRLQRDLWQHRMGHAMHAHLDTNHHGIEGLMQHEQASAHQPGHHAARKTGEAGRHHGRKKPGDPGQLQTIGEERTGRDPLAVATRDGKTEIAGTIDRDDGQIVERIVDGVKDASRLRPWETRCNPQRKRYRREDRPRRLRRSEYRPPTRSSGGVRYAEAVPGRSCAHS